jgi:hypothetical protein
VDAREFERTLERLMRQDFSAGTEEFRDALLQRCLEVLDEGEAGMPLDDDALEQLSAAGSISDYVNDSFPGKLCDNKDDDFLI